MKKLLLTLVCILIIAPMAHAESRYVEGVAAATHIDAKTGAHSTVPVRVYTVSGPQYSDDFIYIEGGTDESRISGHLYENGRRGMANESTYLERSRFEKALMKSQILLKKAVEEGADLKKRPDLFDSFELEIQSMDKGKVARLSMRIWDLERGGSLQLYLDSGQIDSLLGLLAKVPETLNPLKEELDKKEVEKKKRIKKAREAAGLE